MNQKVRVHLKQAVLVGRGPTARYSKVLIGERDPPGDEIYPPNNDRLHAFLITGFMHGYQGRTFVPQTRHRLAASNILSIEDIEDEPASSAKVPDTVWCSVSRVPGSVHAPHHYHGVDGRILRCPGWGN